MFLYSSISSIGSLIAYIACQIYFGHSNSTSGAAGAGAGAGGTGLPSLPCDTFDTPFPSYFVNGYYTPNRASRLLYNSYNSNSDDGMCNVSKAAEDCYRDLLLSLPMELRGRIRARLSAALGKAQPGMYRDRDREVLLSIAAEIESTMSNDTAYTVSDKGHMTHMAHDT